MYQLTLWGRTLRATNYQPGYWALYAAYCAVPVAIYVAYLVKRAKEVNFIVSQDRVETYCRILNFCV